MKKNVVIVVLSVVALLLAGAVGYLIATKNTKVEEDSKEGVIEQAFDLTEAKKLVDKYYKFEAVYSFFETGLTEKQKMVIAFSTLSEEKKLEQSCDSVYVLDSNATKDTYYYTVNLNSFSTSAKGFCDANTKKISYNDINNVYKSLFGADNEIPKEDLDYPSNYDFKDGFFYELSCHCGWAGPNTEIYGIKDANIINDKLIINVGYINVMTEAGFYNPITNETIQEETFRQENFKENFLNQYLDKMDTYELTFEKENDNYVLKNMIKKLYS